VALWGPCAGVGTIDISHAPGPSAGTKVEAGGDTIQANRSNATGAAGGMRSSVPFDVARPFAMPPGRTITLPPSSSSVHPAASKACVPADD
jgi:hypothetical protein